MNPLKKLASVLLHRTTLVAMLLLIQMGVVVVLMERFSFYYTVFYWFCIALSVVVVLAIVGSRGDPGYKIAWLIPVLLFPVFGGVVYLAFGGNRLSRRVQRKMRVMDRRMINALTPDFKAELLAPVGEDAVNQSRYLEKYAHCPLYRNTVTEYFKLGDDAFPRMLEELRQAEKYIFLEYFIIAPGVMWDSVLEILEAKAKAGIDVRVIYDDVGCLYTLPQNYEKTLEAKGIQCCVFNPFIPVLSVRLNNRDHRKFCIIDGKAAFTGGINLADEYVNRKERFGHWKDSAIFLRGEAVWSMVIMFLSMWDYIRGVEEDYSTFRPLRLPHEVYDAPGWVQPYTDSPLDGEPVGETVYLNLITKARRYVYITTPYLIVSDTVNAALRNAAKSGVDVRIMTPHIPDKKTVFEMTRAHYEPLLEAGVRIFEYTPGFVHGKSFAVDDLYATVGSVNMDYRSMFLHFEDGVWLCGDPTVLAVRNDFLVTQKQCQEVTLEQCREHARPRRLLWAVLRVFAPLM